MTFASPNWVDFSCGDISGSFITISKGLRQHALTAAIIHSAKVKALIGKLPDGSYTCHFFIDGGLNLDNSKKSERENTVFQAGLFDDLTVQDAFTIIALYAAQLDTEDCQEDVNRIAALLNEDSLFDEKSSDTLSRINKYTNAMEEVNSIRVVEASAQLLTPELQKKAFMLAAKVGKSVHDSKIETAKILQHLAAKLSVDSKMVNKTITSVIENFLKNVKDEGIFALAQLREGEQIVVTKWAQEIFERFLSVVEKHPTKIKNTLELPASKQDIKMALKILIVAHFIKGSSEILDTLRNHYISIGAFQDIAPDDEEKINGEVNGIEPESGSDYSAVYPIYHKYMEVIIAEQNALLEEVNNFTHELKQVIK